MNLGIYFGPTDEQSEQFMRPQTDDDPDTPLPSDVPPCPDDADFDAPPAQASVGIWDILTMHDGELMELRARVKELEKLQPRIKLEPMGEWVVSWHLWEGSDFVVSVRPVWEKVWRHVPVGGTLSEQEAKRVAAWLQSAIADLWKIFGNVQRDGLGEPDSVTGIERARYDRRETVGV